MSDIDKGNSGTSLEGQEKRREDSSRGARKRYPMTLRQRLLASYKRDRETGCLVWQKQTISGGYGRISVGTRADRRAGLPRMKLAHRVAWETKHGPIPEGKDVLHTCDNPPCCADEHLFLGTHADNMRDMALKKRHPTMRKVLNEDEVVRARRLLERGTLIKDVATRLGIDASAISRMKSGRTYKEVT